MAVLTLSRTNTTGTKTLTGASDWEHYQANVSRTRMTGTPGLLSDYTKIGAAFTELGYNDDGRLFSASDPSTSDHDGIYSGGTAVTGNGFSFTVPAGTSSQTLICYFGQYSADSIFRVSMTGGGVTSPQTDSQADPGFNTPLASNFTIVFQAASAGQTLTVSIEIGATFSASYGNVTISALALTAPAGLTSWAPDSVTSGMMGASRFPSPSSQALPPLGRAFVSMAIPIGERRQPTRMDRASDPLPAIAVATAVSFAAEQVTPRRQAPTGNIVPGEVPSALLRPTGGFDPSGPPVRTRPLVQPVPSDTAAALLSPTGAFDAPLTPSRPALAWMPQSPGSPPALGARWGFDAPPAIARSAARSEVITGPVPAALLVLTSPFDAFLPLVRPLTRLPAPLGDVPTAVLMATGGFDAGRLLSRASSTWQALPSALLPTIGAPWGFEAALAQSARPTARTSTTGDIPAALLMPTGGFDSVTPLARVLARPFAAPVDISVLMNPAGFLAAPVLVRAPAAPGWPTSSGGLPSALVAALSAWAPSMATPLPPPGRLPPPAPSAALPALIAAQALTAWGWDAAPPSARLAMAGPAPAPPMPMVMPPWGFAAPPLLLARSIAVPAAGQPMPPGAGAPMGGWIQGDLLRRPPPSFVPMPDTNSQAPAQQTGGWTPVEAVRRPSSIVPIAHDTARPGLAPGPFVDQETRFRITRPSPVILGAQALPAIVQPAQLAPWGWDPGPLIVRPVISVILHGGEPIAVLSADTNQRPFAMVGTSPTRARGNPGPTKVRNA
ncbi:MAG: hypothetical protein EPN98_21390 [Phenylobacterium sp.]|uniref:hypothetical protein n=1 Tax=Phenylobacterium sp. TaxID=1871053 RepID=UPI0012212A5A|nr:hypothetical protein [Phenylobacterium sp.]TAL28999.1 MAG: hypothetical protein EPN98_21390 [Phenylobacterium sp.]